MNPIDQLGTITFMSSGEMSARLSPAHRAVMSRLKVPIRAIFLDTPAGFQENATALAEKAVGYFNQNLQKELSIVSFKSKADAAPDRIAQVAQQIEAANYIFAGPGSPTYAVRQWIDTPIARAFAARLNNGGHLVFASSAAIAMSRWVVPVYELFKAGHDPYWVDGLNLLGAFGVEVAVMPHWNNSEGGQDFDTRYCFIGRRRFKKMEDLLPDSAVMLGLDENTACLLDLAAKSCEVFGAGRVILRHRGQEKIFASGTKFDWNEFESIKNDK
ncbi:MAG TPA: cysteinyl-tRNA synthetase [Anaerolineae bacterium]|nr:cysteinyl-tRNA synthetase [Anaerolineae bacterium]